MKQVFLSYSSKDFHQTIELMAILERNDISCWIGNRDISPGANYTEEITTAIEQCEVFVLVLTENAQRSQYVISEVECARAKKKHIIPYMLEDFPIIDSLDFHIRNRQRIHAYEDRDQAEEKLISCIQNLISTQPSEESAIIVKPPEKKLIKRHTQYVKNVLFEYDKELIWARENGRYYRILCRNCHADTISNDNSKEIKRLSKKIMKAISWIGGIIGGINAILMLLGGKPYMIFFVVIYLMCLLPSLILYMPKKISEKIFDMYKKEYPIEFIEKHFTHEYASLYSSNYQVRTGKFVCCECGDPFYVTLSKEDWENFYYCDE